MDGRASPDPRSVFRWAFRSHDGSWAGAAPPISSKLRSIGSDRLASSADRRNKSHSRPTIWGNHRRRPVVNPENEVGDLPGRRLAAPSLDRAHFIFGKEHAAVPAVLTPRDTLARKQETPNDFDYLKAQLTMSDYGSDVEDDSEFTLANVGFDRRIPPRYPSRWRCQQRTASRPRRGAIPCARRRPLTRSLTRARSSPPSLSLPQPAVVDKYKVAAEIANSASPPPARAFFRSRAPWSAASLFAHAALPRR